MSNIKQKISNCCSAVPSSMAALGSSWHLCHTICLGLISALASIGIVVTGMPLLFLNQYQLQLWVFAIILFGITLCLYHYKKFGSKYLLLANFGIISAGIPVKENNWIFWLVGGMIILLSIAFYLKFIWMRKNSTVANVAESSTLKKG